MNHASTLVFLLRISPFLVEITKMVKNRKKLIFLSLSFRFFEIHICLKIISILYYYT